MALAARLNPSLPEARLIQAQIACQVPHLMWVMRVGGGSSYQSILGAVYAHLVPLSEFPIVLSYPHYPHLTPNTVELMPTLGALSPRGGPVQDLVLTTHAQ